MKFDQDKNSHKRNLKEIEQLFDLAREKIAAEFYERHREIAEKYAKLMKDQEKLMRRDRILSNIKNALNVWAVFDNSNSLSKPRIIKAPGTTLLAVVDFLFSPNSVQNTFKPLIADWRYEYFEALKQGRKWKALWISTRYHYSFIMAMGLSKVFSFLKQLKSLSK